MASNYRRILILISIIFSPSFVLGNPHLKQSLLQEMGSIPDHQKTEDEKTKEANYSLQATNLRTVLKELYFGDHKVALENYREMKRLNVIQAERTLGFSLMSHHDVKLAIIEKDGYYFIGGY